jgi:hypothetical protein
VLQAVTVQHIRPNLERRLGTAGIGDLDADTEHAQGGIGLVHLFTALFRNLIVVHHSS